MRIQTIFFDLDDTLYLPSCGVWPLIRDRICLYMNERLSIPWEEIPPLRRKLFEQYGTTGRGLKALYDIDEEEYLVYVHDVPIEDHIRPDSTLREMILALVQRRLIFTNASRAHAERVIAALGLDGCFEQIIDIAQIAPTCKPQPEAYQRALTLSGEADASRCLVIDDSPFNLAAAQSIGFQALLVLDDGREAPDHFYRIHRIQDLPQALSQISEDQHARRPE
ncbi:MAG TPA: pyrimidine 5'-nucleotidase [Anaerolineaceae bacterium]|nr:pyrimidine 5'-nucleotidase [Anaerolineaceae bacterium]